MARGPIPLGSRAPEGRYALLTHYDRAAALCPAPAVKADFIEQAEECRDASQAKAHESSLRLLLAMVSETPPKGKKET